jgi:DNA-binding response OmpR family regulator
MILRQHGSICGPESRSVLTLRARIVGTNVPIEKYVWNLTTESMNDITQFTTVAAAVDASPAEQHDGNSLLPQRSVLCVQPDGAKQAFVRDALKGYRVTVATTAFDAIRHTNQSPFDAYILEFWLPDWAGAPLCRHIREKDPNVPIIFYTIAGSEYAGRALRAGAMAYLQAPIDAAGFRERVRLLIEHADIRDLKARIEEERVIQEELERQANVAIDRADAAMRRAKEAIERVAKIKASKAFIRAGGTSAGFVRFWPNQFAAVTSSQSQQADML